jgi:hypothetical protein
MEIAEGAAEVFSGASATAAHTCAVVGGCFPGVRLRLGRSLALPVRGQRKLMGRPRLGRGITFLQNDRFRLSRHDLMEIAEGPAEVFLEALDLAVGDRVAGQVQFCAGGKEL